LEFNLEQLLSDRNHKGCFMANSCYEIYLENEVLLEKLMEDYRNVGQLLVAYLKGGEMSPLKAKSISAIKDE
jgi:hypothetical protein